MAVRQAKRPVVGVSYRHLKLVKEALDTLHDIHQHVVEGRDRDLTSGDEGRYEAAVFRNRQPEINWATSVLAAFRRFAEENGEPSEPIITGFGGEPDLTMSDKALAYLTWGEG